MKQKAIFFDRDGVIVEPINGNAPQNPKDLRIIPEIIPMNVRAVNPNLG